MAEHKDEVCVCPVCDTSTCGIAFLMFVCDWKLQAFVTKWKVPAEDPTIRLPLTRGGTFDFCVSWGDGTPDDIVRAWDQAEASHTYAQAGTYVVRLVGVIDGFSFGEVEKESKAENVGRDRNKLLAVVQWGNVEFGNEGYYFSNCSQLKSASISDAPNLTRTTNLTGMFKNCVCFDGAVEHWNVGQVTNMSCTVHV